MTPDPTRPEYSSPYAPFDPQSALPPGLDERVVANAYKATGFLPKRVLLELGIRRYTGTAAIRLRKALDDPTARARLNRSRSKVRPLHQAIYTLLVNQPAYRAVYKRLVEPSEVISSGPAERSIVLLDPLEFKSRIAVDQRDSSWSERELTPQSDEEGLALFGLAYGLLQPDDAQLILAPILAIGTSFRGFFGATEDVPLPSPFKAPKVERTPRRGASDDDSSPEQMDSEQQPPSENVASSLGTDQSSLHTAAPYRGLRTQSVRKATDTLRSRRATRRSLGNAELLDEPAFNAAYQTELTSVAALKTLEEDLRLHWARTIERYITLAREFGILLSFDPLPTGPEGVATSLDDLESDGAELLRLVAELRANTATARTIGATLPPVLSHHGPPVNLPDGIRSLARYAADTAAALERARRWGETRDVLRVQLRDCAGVQPAKSLRTISPDGITALLEYSLVASDWDTLRPLLFRLWSERFPWSTPGASGTVAALEHALEAAAASDDLDRHAEQLSYLDRDALQGLLGADTGSLARHVVLATFRESLARRDGFFLTTIWGFEHGWTSRPSTVLSLL